ncbi:hypothetical protein ABW19_dt0203962 [Dactylella cylindrospora]|nr:hypothetical protein ABW19_dt0203962 [Dactylella cylindrospora]
MSPRARRSHSANQQPPASITTSAALAPVLLTWEKPANVTWSQLPPRSAICPIMGISERDLGHVAKAMNDTMKENPILFHLDFLGHAKSGKLEFCDKITAEFLHKLECSVLRRFMTAVDRNRGYVGYVLYRMAIKSRSHLKVRGGYGQLSDSEGPNDGGSDEVDEEGGGSSESSEGPVSVPHTRIGPIMPRRRSQRASKLVDNQASETTTKSTPKRRSTGTTVSIKVSTAPKRITKRRSTKSKESLFVWLNPKRPPTIRENQFQNYNWDDLRTYFGLSLDDTEEIRLLLDDALLGLPHMLDSAIQGAGPKIKKEWANAVSDHILEECSNRLIIFFGLDNKDETGYAMWRMALWRRLRLKRNFEKAIAREAK